MRLAVMRSMWWALAHDRGALVMSFVLPPLVFVIFAAIFSGASGGDLNVRLAVHDARADGDSTRLLARLAASAGIEPVEASTVTSADDVRTLVLDGHADVGVVVRANGTRFDRLSAGAEPPLLLVADPSREIAVTALLGTLQAAYFDALPDAVVGGVAHVLDTRIVAFDDAQREALAAGLDAMAGLGADTAVLPFGRLVEREDLFSAGAAPLSVTYYAGAVAILFLLFSASNAAMSLIEERDSGLLDRLAAGPGGTAVLVDGKFAFITLQGFAQVAVIFVVAWLAFGVDLTGHLGAWIATTALAAFGASGLALAFVAVCRSRAQAQSLGTFVIMVMSAVGGSMVPRYMMPDVVRDLGWLTPNTWVLEAYAEVFWRPGTADLTAPAVALAATGLGGLVLARIATARALGR